MSGVERSHLKIFQRILTVWKQEEVIELTWLDMNSWLLTMILRFLAWLDTVGVRPSSDGYQATDQSVVSFLKSTTSA